MGRNPKAPVDCHQVEHAGEQYRYLALPLRAGVGTERLTASERDVVARVLRGESNAAIACGRGTSERTVANQLRAIYAKLGVGSRHELCAKVSEGD